METIHTIEGSFGNEFPPIYNHCRVDGLNSTFSLFWKSHPLREHFQNSARKKIHRNSNRRVVFKFRDFRPREIGDVMIYMTKISPGSSLCSSHYCADIVPKICQGQPQTMYWECSRFHPNQFTFRGVISERVNTATACSEVNSIFSWSLASSQIIIMGNFNYLGIDWS